MARKPIKQRISFEGEEKLKKDLEALGKAGEKAFNQIQVAAQKVHFEKFGASLRVLGSEFAAFGRRASLAIASFGLLGGISFAGTSRALFHLAEAAAEVADQTGKAAQKAGLTTEAFSKMAFAAEQNDISQETLVTSLSRLNKQIAAAAGGQKKAVDVFHDLGVSIKDAQGRLRPTQDIVHDLAAAFAKLPDGVKKSTIAMQLFGRGGAALIPFLNEGKAGILELEKQAEQLGITLTEQQSIIGDALGDSLNRVTNAIKGIKLQLGLIFAPAVTRVADLFTKRIIASRQAFVAFGEELANRIVPVVEDVINALSGNDADVKNSVIIELRNQMIGFGTATKQAITGIVIPAFKALKVVLDGIAELINGLFGTNFSGTAVGIGIALAQLTGAFRLLAAGIRVAYFALLLFARNPIAAAIILIAIRLNQLIDEHKNAKTAAQNHATALAELQQALADVKNNVPGAEQVLNHLAAAHLNSAMAAVADAQAQVDAAQRLLDIERDRANAPADVPGGEENELAKQLKANELKRIDEQSGKLIEANIILANRLRQLQEIQDTIAGKSIDKIEDVRPKAKAAADAVAEVGAAADKTKAQVESLGHTIKVTSFGTGGKSEKLFEVDSAGLVKASQDVTGLTTQLSQVDDQAGEAGTALDGVDDQATSMGTSAEIASPKVDKLNTSLKDTSTSVINVATALGRVATDATTLGVASDAVATKLATAKGSADELFATASNNSAGLSTALDTTRDSAAGLGTALADTATAATNLGTSFADTEAIAIAVANSLLAPFQAVGSGIQLIMNSASNVVRSGFQSLQSLIASVAVSISSSISRIISQLQAAAAAAQRLQAAAKSGSSTGSSGNSRLGFAGGGHVSGPGTSTSDSILAWLSDDEWVMRAAAVKKYGHGFMAMINSLKLPKDFFRNLPKLRAGGVPGLTTRMKIPRLAAGGSVKALAPAGNGFTQPVHLHFERPGGGETTVLVMAQADAPTQMMEFARSSARNATGRPQSWKGRAG